MRRSIMLATAAVMSLCDAAGGGAQAQGTYWPWCVHYRDASYNCGFANYQQCLSTAIRARGICRENPLPPGYGKPLRGDRRMRPP
jgi:hypothetical protein